MRNVLIPLLAITLAHAEDKLPMPPDANGRRPIKYGCRIAQVTPAGEQPGPSSLWKFSFTVEYAYAPGSPTGWESSPEMYPVTEKNTRLVYGRCADWIVESTLKKTHQRRKAERGSANVAGAAAQ